ncbi:MAG: hypothetical protein CMJ59_03075 [Planctomycetaceae bacterium]|nr:hypothetical protein [Planctomycetaceae bacterium]
MDLLSASDSYLANTFFVGGGESETAAAAVGTHRRGANGSTPAVATSLAGARFCFGRSRARESQLRCDAGE